MVCGHSTARKVPALNRRLSLTFVRQEAEIFMAEILEQQAWHLQWLNADGENPFPASVFNLIDWLQRFQPKDGKSFKYTEYPDVCPAGGLRLLQPSVAENSHH